MSQTSKRVWESHICSRFWCCPAIHDPLLTTCVPKFTLAVTFRTCHLKWSQLAINLTSIEHAVPLSAFNVFFFLVANSSSQIQIQIHLLRHRSGHELPMLSNALSGPGPHCPKCCPKAPFILCRLLPKMLPKVLPKHVAQTCCPNCPLCRACIFCAQAAYFVHGTSTTLSPFACIWHLP